MNPSPAAARSCYLNSPPPAAAAGFTDRALFSWREAASLAVRVDAADDTRLCVGNRSLRPREGAEWRGGCRGSKDRRRQGDLHPLQPDTRASAARVFHGSARPHRKPNHRRCRALSTGTELRGVMDATAITGSPPTSSTCCHSTSRSACSTTWTSSSYFPLTSTRARRSTSVPLAKTDHLDGTGDFQTRLKINLWGNDGPTPTFGDTSFAFLPFIQAPTSSRGLGSDHVEGGMIFPFDMSLPASAISARRSNSISCGTTNGAAMGSSFSIRPRCTTPWQVR